MSNRRVVVTGLGIVSPVGNNLKETWGNITAGKSGVIAIDTFDTTAFAAKIAATVKADIAVKNHPPITVITPVIRNTADSRPHALSAKDVPIATINVT